MEHYYLVEKSNPEERLTVLRCEIMSSFTAVKLLLRTINGLEFVSISTDLEENKRGWRYKTYYLDGTRRSIFLDRKRFEKREIFTVPSHW